MGQAPPPYMQNSNFQPDQKMAQSYNQGMPAQIQQQGYSLQMQPQMHQQGFNPQMQQPGFNLQQMQQSSIFPPSFGFYHAHSSHSDMIIALEKDAGAILHISTHNAWSSQPNVVLHSGPNSSSPPLGSAKFVKLHVNTTEIVVHASSTSQAFSTKMTKEGTFTKNMTFHAPTNASPSPEQFIWKSSSGAEVQELEGRSHGMKLERTSTGEIVAAWAKPGASHAKKGKMEWMGSGAGLGEAFKIAAVVTIVAIMEKKRRNERTSAASIGGVSAS